MTATPLPREELANVLTHVAGALVYLAPTRINLQLAQERAPGVEFLATREQAHVVGAR